MKIIHFTLESICIFKKNMPKILDMFEFTKLKFLGGKVGKGWFSNCPFFGALNFASHVAILSTMPTSCSFIKQ